MKCGIALACRQPQEVLFIRDDNEPILPVRDVRSAMMGRADKGLIITSGTFTLEAKKTPDRDWSDEQLSVVDERHYRRYVRVQLELRAQCRSGSSTALRQCLKNTSTGHRTGDAKTTFRSTYSEASTPRLLDKGLIQLAGSKEK